MSISCDICYENISIEGRTYLKHCVHRFCYSCIIIRLHMINPVTGEDLSRCETVYSPITDGQYTPPMEDLEDSWSPILAVTPSAIDAQSSVS